MRSRALTLIGIGIGVVLVVTAWAVTMLAPTPEMREAPVEVRSGLGEWAVGRNITAVVSDPSLVERLSDGDALEPWNGETTGRWIVVRVEAASLHRNGSLVARLDYGGLLLPASERPPTSVALAGAPLAPGIAVSGMLAFELPEQLPMPQTATVRISASRDDRLDSVLVTRLDLSSLTVLPELVLDEVTERGTP